MSWKALGKPTVRQQRGKWVVRVDGIETATGAKLPRQLGTFASQRAARTAASAFTADGVVQADRGNVAWAVDRWLATKSDVSAKSRSQYEWAAKHVKAGLGGIPLERLERTDVSAWLDGLADGGTLARRSIQILRTVLRASLADVVDDGMLRRSPASRVALPKDVAKPGLDRAQPAWSEVEVARFIAAAGSHRWSAGFRMCVFYGLRRSELLALRWDDVDLDAGTVRIDEGLIEVNGKPVWTDGKSARSRRTIPIDVEMRRRFRSHRVAQLEAIANALVWEPSDLVLTTQTGAFVQARNFDRVLDRIVRDAGVTRLTSHGLRHTAATHMVRHAHDLGELRAIADILGHSPEMLMRIYAHTMPESLRAVSEGVGRRSMAFDV